MKSESIYILATPGVVVPFEGRGRRRVPQGDPKTDAAKAVRATDSRYYRRMTRDGAIQVIPAAVVEKAKKAITTKPGKEG